MKKIVLTLTAVLILAWGRLSFAESSVDALIQKLEDKGILTDQEASQVKGEIAHDEKASQQTTFKSLLPDWLNNIKLTGDFRLRDCWQRVDVAAPPGHGSSSSRAAYNRVRVRARLNIEDQINDKVKVVFGIATNGENTAGVGNPRSNNLTLGGNNNPSEDSFNKPSVVVNKAYVAYTPASYATLEAGKMDNPIWEPWGTSLLWDPNETPEGGVVQLQKKINDYVTPFSTNAIFVLADSSPVVGPTNSGFKTDPYMFVTQDGIKGNLTDKVYYKTAVSYYGISNPNHVTFGNRPSSSTAPTNNTNSTSSTGLQYTYSYYLIGGTAELGINDPLGGLLPSYIRIPQAGVIGQYFQNQDPSHDNAAWQIGGYAGKSAISGFGDWKVSSYYKVLERDSWLDTLPDINFYNGATDTVGWVNELDFGLAKNIWFTLTYYHANVYKHILNLSSTVVGNAGSTAFSGSAPEDVILADVNFKF